MKTKLPRALSATAGILLLALAGCQTAAEQDPAAAPSRPAEERYYSYIRIEGVVIGGTIKLNSDQVSYMPGYVTVEVDFAGKAVRRYVVEMSTNILANDAGIFSIEQGQDIPARIYFGRTGPAATGTARVERSR